MADEKIYRDMPENILMETTVFPSMSRDAEVFKLSGIIKSISDKTITITLQNPTDALGDPSLDERLVTIDNKTKITVAVQKSQETFDKELAEYRSRTGTVQPGDQNMPAPPQIFIVKGGDISSLKIGAMIDVTTAENVRNKKSFTALTIEMTGIPAFPPSAN